MVFLFKRKNPATAAAKMCHLYVLAFSRRLVRLFKAGIQSTFHRIQDDTPPRWGLTLKREPHMARYKVTPSLKRGPGRPRKTEAVTASVKTGARRGRKPGVKNKSFLERVVIQSDAIDTALAALIDTLNDAIMKDDVVPTQNILTAAEGLVRGMGETLTDAVGKLGNLPEGYVPGKKEVRELTWEKGSYVIFKHPTMKQQFKDAYEIVGLIELGKGNGNGTMIQIEKGLFPKSQLELIDASGLEDAKPSAPPATATATVAAKTPRSSAPRNGHEVIVPVAQVTQADDLNA